MRRPVEQLGAQVSLQAPDLIAERGLRDVRALGRAAEMQLLGECHDETQLP